MMIDAEYVLSWLRHLYALYAENKEHLTELDSAIGDADHGINMERGFAQVVTELEKTPPKSIDEVLKSTAMILIKTVGGAAGPLYGTFFLRAGTACAGKEVLRADDVVSLLEAGLEGVVQRGKAGLNDKTMVDALSPALIRMREVLAEGAGLKEILRQGAEAARRGMEDTIPMLARKGRASYLGERSIGHQDPGATSAYLLVDSMSRIFGESQE